MAKDIFGEQLSHLLNPLSWDRLHMLHGCFIRSSLGCNEFRRRQRFKEEFVSALWTENSVLHLIAGAAAGTGSTYIVDVHDEEAARRPYFTPMPFDAVRPCLHGLIGKMLIFACGLLPTQQQQQQLASTLLTTSTTLHHTPAASWIVVTKFGQALLHILDKETGFQNLAWLEGSPLRINTWRIVYDVQWSYNGLVPTEHSFFKDVEEEAVMEEAELVGDAVVANVQMRNNVFFHAGLPHVS
jgi:hypothetical protein